jgi:uncharacterized protein involved in exopolysaccharide biosynthesis
MKSSVWIVVVGLLTLAPLASHRSTAGDVQHEAHSMELALQEARAALVARFGPKHPAVKVLDLEIAAVVEPSLQADGIAGAKAKSLPLHALLVEREIAARKFGSNHPRVKELEVQISAIVAQGQLDTPEDAAELNGASLRHQLQQLLDRVENLERQVTNFKERKDN